MDQLSNLDLYCQTVSPMLYSISPGLFCNFLRNGNKVGLEWRKQVGEACYSHLLYQAALLSCPDNDSLLIGSFLTCIYSCPFIPYKAARLNFHVSSLPKGLISHLDYTANTTPMFFCVPMLLAYVP